MITNATISSLTPALSSPCNVEDSEEVLNCPAAVNHRVDRIILRLLLPVKHTSIRQYY